MKHLSILFLLGLVAAGCASPKTSTDQQSNAATAAASKTLPTTVEEAVNSPYRTAQNRERDGHRHPVETLNFFGLKPEMTVVEISPGSGWYMEILAPLLNTKGQYIGAAAPSEAGAYFAEMNAKIAAWLKSHPELEQKVKLTAFNPPAQLEIAPEGTADMVLTFRNVHNWVSKGNEQAAFKAFFKALKPGGVLGVVEHRANPKAKKDPKAKSGYVLERDVIRMAEKAGFKLEAKSEINANPKDTKDYPEGVWTLPPTLRLKEKDRDRYVAIGESDRMTLKFIKPAAKK